MAKSLNQVVILGNLTRDPELRMTAQGQNVCNFTLALNRSYKNGNQWAEATDYIDVIAWSELGQTVADHVEKGQPVLVNGRLKSSQWEQAGVKRNKVEVVAQDVIFLQKANKVDSMPHKEEVLADIDENFSLDDIPF